MYLTQSLVTGLRILGFDKDAIKKVSKEKKLEEIFLSTLFLNYVIVLIIYVLGLITGGYSIEGRALNMPVIYGLLMVYPFAFNLVVYGIYGFFGVIAEMLNKKNHVKPIIEVGFHTAIVYAIVLYVIALMGIFSTSYALFLLSAFVLYFVYTMFLAISTVYGFSFGQALMVVFIPFLLIGLLLLIIMMFAPSVSDKVIVALFA